MLKSNKNSYLLSNITTIGRAESNDIVINSPLLSKFHAKILLDDMLIIDLQSKNGTFVGTLKIHNQHQNIKFGDYIKFGNYDEVFQLLEIDNFIQIKDKHLQDLEQKLQYKEEFQQQNMENMNICKNYEVVPHLASAILDKSDIKVQESGEVELLRDSFQTQNTIQQKTLLKKQQEVILAEEHVRQLQIQNQSLVDQLNQHKNETDTERKLLIVKLQKMTAQKVIDISILEQTVPIENKIYKLLNKQNIIDQKLTQQAMQYLQSLQQNNAYFNELQGIIKENEILKTNLIPIFELRQMQQQFFNKIKEDNEKQDYFKLLQEEIIQLQTENSLQQNQLKQLITDNQIIQSQLNIVQDHNSLLRQQLGSALNFEARSIQHIQVDNKLFRQIIDVNKTLSQFTAQVKSTSSIGDTRMMLLAIAKSFIHSHDVI
ncbi:FHA domain-containing protein [Spironucleus salmonicida]|uniref:FHA domain-containing protein n=1 Tax=Spironucleus salmonicida TaxID=348837 RepID=V6LXU6_9EUKA|nr:FHA domain-containing protein [Spironucleus salmonicida]|eukprot:EST49462.1 FHA domain-containing protein [Spironucleus salmonicida]